MVTALAPVPSVSSLSKPMCAPAGPIAGKTIGLRRDKFWVAWDYVTDEWARLLEQDGATAVIWRAPVGKDDKEAVKGSEEFHAFLKECDFVISGLANCGSCTLWAIHDTVGSLNHGTPTVACCTEHFEGLARTLAGLRGHKELRLKVLPYPLEGRSEDEVRHIAREHYESMLETLGAER